MIDTLRIIAIDCGVVFGGALVLVALLRFGGGVLDALPMSRAGRASIGRLRPLVATTLIAVYAVVATRWVLASADSRESIAFALVAGIIATASWSAIRDAIEGVYVRMGKSLAIGDRVDIDGIRGRIQRLSARSITIESIDGELAIIPYRTVVSTTIRREPSDDHSAFHVFRIAIPETRSIPEIKRAVHEAALLCHWSSTRRPPQVNATNDGQLEITVFPVDANHVTEIERAVRRALA